jgi:hypothetical protein
MPSAISAIIAIILIIIMTRLEAINLIKTMARLIGGLRTVYMRCPSTTGPGVVFVRTLGATPEPVFGGLMIVTLSQSVRIQVSTVGR